MLVGTCWLLLSTSWLVARRLEPDDTFWGECAKIVIDLESLVVGRSEDEATNRMDLLLNAVEGRRSIESQ